MAEPQGISDSARDRDAADPADRRLYVRDGENWMAASKHGSESQYCYVQTPGEEFFHLILDGEIFLHNEDEQICLNCAVRRGLLTANRLFWQHRATSQSPDI